VSETTDVGVGLQAEKRVRRTTEEKLRIVKATLVPGASIARVAREHGVNANQVFQWRYEYRKGISPPRPKEARAELLPVTVTAGPSSSIIPTIVEPESPTGLPLYRQSEIYAREGVDLDSLCMRSPGDLHNICADAVPILRMPIGARSKPDSESSLYATGN
jgi:transposase